MNIENCFNQGKFNTAKFILFVFVIVFLLLFFMVFVITNSKISLEKDNFDLNETISGRYNILLNDGELIPSDTLVKVSFDGKLKQITLKEFIELNRINLSEEEGEFYLDGTNISGFGKGYGFPGQKTTYPYVYFQLRVLETNNTNQTNVTSNESIINGTVLDPLNETELNNTFGLNETETNYTQEENPIENPIELPEELPVEPPIENPSEEPTGPIEPTEPATDFGEGVTSEETTSSLGFATITSEVISHFGQRTIIETKRKLSDLQKINLSTRYLKDYSRTKKILVYDSGLGRLVEAKCSAKETSVVPGSVHSNTKNLDSSVINLGSTEECNIYTTDYSEIEYGFGKDYLVDRGSSISLNLDIFELSSDTNGEKDLIIELVYNNETLSIDAIKVLIGEINETNITNITIECTVDENCSDENDLTIDYCFNSSCMHQLIECFNDSECDDIDNKTIDICVEYICMHELNQSLNLTNETKIGYYLIKDDPSFDVFVDNMSYNGTNKELYLSLSHDFNESLNVYFLDSLNLSLNYTINKETFKKNESVEINTSNYSLQDYFEIKFGNNSEIIGFGELPEYNFDLEIKTTLNESLNATFEFQKPGFDNLIFSTNESNATIKRGEQAIKIKLENGSNSSINEISFNNFFVSQDISEVIKIDFPEIENNSNFSEIFALSINKEDFKSVNLIGKSVRTKLLECDSWDFYNRICNGNWTEIQNLSESDYEIKLDYGVYAFAQINETLPWDISLISPINNEILHSQNLTFIYKIYSLQNISKCSLILNNAINQTNENNSLEQNQTFDVYGLGYENHSWQIRCENLSQNNFTSEVRNFSVISNETNLSEIRIIVKDSKKKEVFSNLAVYGLEDETVEFIKEDNSSVKQTVKVLKEKYDNKDKIHKLKLKPGKYNLEIAPQGDKIGKIKITDFDILPGENKTEVIYIQDDLSPVLISDNATLRLDTEIISKKLYFYSVDLSELNFTKAIIESTSQANALYKCREWNEKTKTCESKWFFDQRLSNGQYYGFEASPGKWGFREGKIKEFKQEYKKPEIFYVDGIQYAKPQIERNVELDEDNNGLTDSLEDKISVEKDKEISIIVTTYKPINEEDLAYFKEIGGKIKYKYEWASYGFAGTISADKIEKIKDSLGKNLCIIEEDLPLEMHLDKSLQIIAARPTVWQTYDFKGSPNNSLVSLDTGVDPTHPDTFGYINASSAGWDFVSNEKIVGWQDVFGENSTPVAIQGHGQHTASIAVGTGDSYGTSSIDNLTVTLQRTSSGSSPSAFAQLYDVAFPGIIKINYSISATGNKTAICYFPNGTEMINISGNKYGTQEPLIVEYNATVLGIYQCNIGINDINLVSKSYSALITFPYSQVGDGYNLFTGVAPENKLVLVKIMNNAGSGTASDLQAGYDWVVANKYIYHIKAATSSVGLSAEDATTNQKINSIVANGIPIASSAGNNYCAATEVKVVSPGTASKVVTVGGTNYYNQVAFYSSNGATGSGKPDVVAPAGGSSGPSICSADSNFNDADNASFSDRQKNDTGYFRGTSASTPHAGGLFALMIQAWENTTEQQWDYSETNALQLKKIMLMTAWETNQQGEYCSARAANNTPTLNRGGKDLKEGFGRINADAAIEAISYNYSIGTKANATLSSEQIGKKVWARKIALQAGKVYNFTLNIPASADFDLFLYHKDYDTSSASIGDPIYMKSTSSSTGATESINASISESGNYYIVVKQVSGSGEFNLTSNESQTSVNDSVSVWFSDDYIYVESTYYKLRFRNNTGYTNFGQILDGWDKRYSNDTELSQGYFFQQIDLYKSAPAGWVGIASAFAPTNGQILESGPERVVLKFDFGSTLSLYWYFYGEYYSYRLWTSGLATTYDDGIRTFGSIINDTNTTSAGDSYGQSWAQGGKAGPTYTQSSATSTTYDVFDVSSTATAWSSWFGDLTTAQISNKMPSGAADAFSYIQDTEATGADYHLSGWTLALSLTNYDNLISIARLGQGNNSLAIQNIKSLYDYIPGLTCVSNCSSTAINSKEFINEIYANTISGNNVKFNVTGNSSWNYTNERIYFIVYNVTNNNDVYYSTTGTNPWILVSPSSAVQYVVNGSRYNAIFSDNISKTETRQYFLNNDTTAPTVTLNSPVNVYNSSSSSVTFNCSAIDNGFGLANISLWLNSTGTWARNVTNATIGNSNSTLNTRTFADGTYKWSCSANDSSGNQNISFVENRTFTVDTTACAGSTYNFVCGDTINQSCTMNGNLTSSGTCFTIGVNNLIVNGNGYAIIGNNSKYITLENDGKADYYLMHGVNVSSGIGINVSDYNNVTIKDFQINKFYVGVLLNSSNNSIIYNNIFDDNGKAEIFAINSNNNNITKNYGTNTSSSCQYLGETHCVYSDTRDESGIALCNSSNNNWIRDFTLYGNSTNNGGGIDKECGVDSGISIRGAGLNNTIYDITLYYPDTYGILIYDLSHNTNISYYNLYGANTIGKSTNDMIIQSANTENLTIKNFYGENTTEWGPFIDASINAYLDNVTVKNTKIGIRLTTNSTNATIKNSYVTGSASEGIYLANAVNATFTNNTANSNNYGISLNSSSNSTLTNNTANSNSLDGIYLYSSSNSTLTNNTANSNSEYGIYLHSFSNNNIITNNIANSNSEGISLDGSSNNIITNNIANSNYRGITLDGSSNNNTITNNTASSNSYGTYLRSSVNNTFIDSNISNSTTKEIYSTGATSNNTFLNCSFNKSNVQIADGVVYVKWYLDAYVNYTNGTAVNGAYVIAYNNANALTFNKTTNSSGFIQRQNVTEYYQNSTNKYFYTNYSVNATKSEFDSETKKVNLTGNYIVGQNGPVNLTIENCSINFTMSENLTNGAHFGMIDGLPVTNYNASGNNASGITKYDLSLKINGTCKANIYIKGWGALTSGTNTIGLGNESFCYNNTNSSVPGIDCTTLTTDYQLIGYNLSSGNYSYLKFYLDVPGGQAAGYYNNIFGIRANKTIN